ncbi:MAG: phosphopantothenoylcysteine decarboxylase [Planctomycetota bacterium]|nr:phosphopantothenoylcysteine decarboxylase [Planctomycetota bacterium]MDA1249172.1 phosphopantothenoylcysteine decarboxylase [Planctomycetota bacterium]
MKILLTAGPTREYLDDVRYLSNASSGRMGYALAQAGLDAGHEVVLLSGPVDLVPPEGCDFRPVVTTAEMRAAAVELFPDCDGVIAAAAVCDYTPRVRTTGKMTKTGEPITIELIETDDVLAQLGATRGHRWVIGFALEAENARENALQKLRAKNCDAVVLNGPSAIGSETNEVQLLGPQGETLQEWSGSKTGIASSLIRWIDENLASPT